MRFHGIPILLHSLCQEFLDLTFDWYINFCYILYLLYLKVSLPSLALCWWCLYLLFQFSSLGFPYIGFPQFVFSLCPLDTKYYNFMCNVKLFYKPLDIYHNPFPICKQIHKTFDEQLYDKMMEEKEAGIVCAG